MRIELCYCILVLIMLSYSCMKETSYKKGNTQFSLLGVFFCLDFAKTGVYKRSCFCFLLSLSLLENTQPQ